VTNIPAYRKAAQVSIDVPGGGSVTGDVAWGGNWFFLTEQHGLELTLSQVERLTDFAWRTRLAANAQGFPEVDHVVLLGPPRSPEAHSQNFVLCPGKAYDRSPCGTGTSARLACLAADARLTENEPYVQESILRTCFTGRYRWLDRREGRVIPTITGAAHVTAEATLILNEDDPFCWGI
jgi:proline racemase